jgi:anti-sigma regulatory factor (Ser/Thr protein kinase)
VDDALIIVSELVTNAVQHVDWQVYPGKVIVHAYLGARGLVIEVRDPSPAPPLPAGAREVLRECGQGLPLIRGLAREFNHSLLPNGKSVWAVCGVD